MKDFSRQLKVVNRNKIMRQPREGSLVEVKTVSKRDKVKEGEREVGDGGGGG